MYSTILFDWDGCLARTLHVWLRAYHKAYASYGIQVTDRQVGAGFGDGQAQHRYGVPAEDNLKYMTELRDHARELMDEVTLYDGASDLLTALRRSGKKLGLITSSSRTVLSGTLERLELTDAFDVIVTVEDVKAHKPHPEPLEKALDALGVEKSGAVMIGDSDKDVLAARNTGIDSILVFPDEHDLFYDRDDLLALRPTHVCSSLIEIASILGITLDEDAAPVVS